MKKVRNSCIALCLAIISLALVACGTSTAIAYGTVARTTNLIGGSTLSYTYNESTHTAWFGGTDEVVGYYTESAGIGTTAGNRVGITITAPTELSSYDGFKMTIYDTTIYEGLNDNGIPTAFDGTNYINIYPLVSGTQTGVSIKIKWNSMVDEQTYWVKIVNGTTFATA